MTSVKVLLDFLIVFVNDEGMVLLANIALVVVFLDVKLEAVDIVESLVAELKLESRLTSHFGWKCSKLSMLSRSPSSK